MAKIPAQLLLLASRKKQIPFSRVIVNVELVQEWYPQHLRMDTERMKYDEDTEGDNKQSKKISKKE